STGCGGGRGQRVEELGKPAARGERLGNAVFQHELGAEILVAQEVLGGELDGLARNQADDFAAGHGHSIAFGLAAHRFEDDVHGRLFEIGEVDGDLRQIARGQHNAHGLHGAEAAAGEADGLGDAFGDGDVGRVEVDVIGHQKLARAGDGGASGGVADGVADIRIARRHGAHFLYERLKLAAAYVLQVGAFRPARRGFVQVDRDSQLAPDLGAQALGELHALFQGDAFDRDEGDYVGGADAGVGALLFGEIDQGDGLFHRAEGGLGYGGGGTGGRQDAAVMIGIGFAVQQDHLGDVENGLHDGDHN